MNIKKIGFGVLLVVAYMLWGAYVQPFLNVYLPFIPTGYTFWLSFIPITIGIGTIVLAIGILLLIFGIFV